MGLRDDIATLEARFEAGHQVGQQLAEAYAEMITRKNSKGLVFSWFRDLASVLENLGRYSELINAADGVNPADLGAWDCQKAVAAWLAQQQSPDA